MRNPVRALLIITGQLTLTTGLLMAGLAAGHASEHHDTPRPVSYVAQWDSAGWQDNGYGTVSRTALDSRGDYTEVTCRPWHGILVNCLATAADGTHPAISRLPADG